jgi:hypothetical protein
LEQFSSDFAIILTLIDEKHIAMAENKEELVEHAKLAEQVIVIFSKILGLFYNWKFFSGRALRRHGPVDEKGHRVGR